MKEIEEAIEILKELHNGILQLSPKITETIILLRSIKPPDIRISDIAIPCPEECGGILEVKEFVDRPTCNECGKVFMLCVGPPEAGELSTKLRETLECLDNAVETADLDNKNLDEIDFHLRELIAEKMFKLCELANKAAEKLDHQAAELKDTRLELACPETLGSDKEELYKVAATVMCEKHRLAAELKELKEKQDADKD